MASLINTEKYSQYYHRLGVIYQKPEIKASLEVIFSVFMIGLLIFVAIRPTLTNITALQKKITDKESISTKADKKIAQLFTAQDQLTQNVNFLSLYDSAVPENFSYLDMVGRIELLARNTNVEVESLSVGGINLNGNIKPSGEWQNKILKVDEKGMIVATLDFQVFGKSGQVKNFLIQAENMDRLAMIKNVTMSKESGSVRGSEKIKTNGQLQFYVYLPPAKR
jgi:hypothetical protein